MRDNWFQIYPTTHHFLKFRRNKMTDLEFGSCERDSDME